MNEAWIGKDMETALDGKDADQTSMMNESCILVDNEDNAVGSMSKLESHYMEGRLHRAFSVLLFNSKDELLVQKRASSKITFPSVWANSCCSHPLMLGGTEESVVDAAIRKMEQELGIPSSISSDWDYNPVGRFMYSSRWDSEWVEREIDHVLLVRADVEVAPNPNEIGAHEWVDMDELVAWSHRRGDGETRSSHPGSRRS